MKRYPSLAAYLAGTGRTQEQLAADLGVRQGLISKYVRGEQTPRLDLAIRLSAITGVPLEALTRRDTKALKPVIKKAVVMRNGHGNDAAFAAKDSNRRKVSIPVDHDRRKAS
jgi:transcriptional regulator with XRE-family HTH domain